jgi:apolipoprotein N-acyltransferase
MGGCRSNLRALLRPAPADLAAIAAGLALPFAFAPWGYWPLALLSPAALFLSWRGARPGRAAGRGFLYGFAAFLTGTWWTFISVHEFGAAPAALALFLTVALAALMAGYYALLGWLAARWLPPGGVLRWLVGLPAAWTAVEWLRGWFLSGFPWLSLGYSQTDSALGALAPLGGVYGLGWICALGAGALAAVLVERLRVRAVAVATLFAMFAAAGHAGGVTWTEPAGPPIRAVMVQGAVGQDEKWLESALAPTRELYLELTRPFWGADLIIWPEAAIPALLHHEMDFIELLDAKALAAGSELLLGILERDPATGQYHNILVSLGGEPEIYRKRQLVPFGEYFPVPAFVRRWMRLMNLPYTDFRAGASGSAADGPGRHARGAHDLLRGRIRRAAAGVLSGGGAAGQCQQRRLVRRHPRAAPAPADRAHALDGNRSLDASRHQQRGHGGHRSARTGHAAFTPVRRRGG